MDKVMPSCLASFSREKNRKHLSQPEADQNNLKWPSRINGWHRHWEDAMQHSEQRDPETTISRRTLVHGLAVCAGATVAGASAALAQGGPQGGPVAPPSTITSPPRDFSPRGAPTTYFWDPDIIAVDPSFNDLAQPNTAIKRLYTGVLWAEYRGIVGRRSGLERAGPLSPVERHSQQQADAIFRG
jgi:hypothetical protein